MVYEFYDIDNLVSKKWFLLLKSLTLEHYSRKMNKLRNICTIGRRARNITIKKWEINYFKIKTIPFKIILFIIKLDDTMPFVMDKSKSKKGLQYQRNLHKLKFSGIYLTYHLLEIRIINIKQDI